MMRLAIWTARNDFREACKSELEAGLQQTAVCNKTLTRPVLPPPIKKRMLDNTRTTREILKRQPWALVVCSALLLLSVCKALQYFLYRRQKHAGSAGALDGDSTSRHVLSGQAVTAESAVQTKSMENSLALITVRMCSLVVTIEQDETRGRIGIYLQWHRSTTKSIDSHADRETESADSHADRAIAAQEKSYREKSEIRPRNHSIRMKLKCRESLIKKR